MKKYPKTPKLKREANRGCKLSSQDIRSAQRMHKSGIGYASIGRQFGVSWTAIRYWCWSEEKRKEENKKHKDKVTAEQQRENYKRHMEYKQSVLKEEMRNFNTEQSRVFRENNPGYYREWYRKHKNT